MKRILSAVLACVLLVGCVFALASCGGPNSDPAKAEAALKEEGYTVAAIPTFGLAGVKKAISAYKVDGENNEGVQIFYLTEDADADKAYEEIEKLYNEAKEEDEDIDLKIGKADGMIWFGTADAIKAAK